MGEKVIWRECAITAYGIDAERLHILTYHELRNLNAVIYRNCPGRMSRYSTRTHKHAHRRYNTRTSAQMLF